MIIKKMFYGLMVVVLMSAACACTPSDISSESSPTSTIAPTASADSSLRSYTTGMPIDKRSEYKPVGVMIENSAASRPQYGLQAADIVYEAPVEGCTRFFCIYNDTIPSKVGPVRSARLYYIRMQQEWDCAYVHFGGPQSGLSNVYLASSAHIKTRIDLIKGSFSAYYWRDQAKKAPHNAFTDVGKCQELMENEAKVRTFSYNAETKYAGNNVSDVTIPFYSGSVTYRYDAAKDSFFRYMNNEPFTDAETGTAVEVQNLIVQYNKFYHGNEKKGRWLCDLTGSGKADFFIGGKHISGTWERESYNTPTVYKDSNGKEIVLRPGNTWIAMHPEEKDIAVTY